MYASIIPIEDIKLNNTLAQIENDMPQVRANEILARYYEESQGSIYPSPTWKIHKIGKHDFHVNFSYNDSTNKTFNGKHWV